MWWMIVSLLGDSHSKRYKLMKPTSLSSGDKAFLCMPPRVGAFHVAVVSGEIVGPEESSFYRERVFGACMRALQLYPFTNVTSKIDYVSLFDAT